MYIIDLEGERTQRPPSFPAVAVANKKIHFLVKVESMFWHLLTIFKCITSWWRTSLEKISNNSCTLFSDF